MPTYVLPQPLIFQDFDLAVASDNRKMTAHISGPHGHLVRYTEADEKEDSLLGYYDSTQDTLYPWPGLPAGSKIDSDYTKVFIENALLKYFDNAGDEVLPITASEEFRGGLDGINWKSETGYARHALLKDRDVKVGDIVRIRGVDNNDDAFEVWTYVTGFHRYYTNATIGSASSEVTNQGTVTATSSYTKTGGATNCVDISAISHASYSGLRSGNISETYYIEVIQGSTGGDLTTAKFRVTSASGNDDVAEVTPSADGVATAIGTRGLTVTWSVDSGSCSDDALDDGYTPEDFIVGQLWRAEVRQAFTAPTATSGGSSTTLRRDLTYIVEVSEGGLFSETSYPKITVTTSDGTDISGPTVVTAAATPISIGSYGVTISFNQTGLRKGDKYYIPVTGGVLGAASTLLTAHQLSAPQQSVYAGQGDLEIALFIKKNLTVPQKSEASPGQLNWEISADPEDGITLSENIVVYDSSWTDGGELVSLPVESSSAAGYGKAYVSYRAWLSDLCGILETVTLETYDELISGKTDPDNILKYAAFKALSNSNGEPVKVTAVCDPTDLDSWNDVIDAIDGQEVYGLVPCTHNREVKELFKAHALSQSDEEINSWRVAWTVLEAITEKAIVDNTITDDLEHALATITINGDDIYFDLTSANVGFITQGVRVGDIVRYSYTVDAFGDTVYSTCVVSEVLTENALKVASGPTVSVGAGARIEIYRDLKATEQADELAQVSGSYDCRRVMSVWPDRIGVGGTLVDGYFLCAALAGLASGILPHQGMTNLAISGFDSVERTTRLFRRANLNRMAEAGTWIVTQNNDGNIFTRHAVTTGDYANINDREEMVVRNMDNISFYWLDRFSPYIGIANAVPAMQDVLEAETLAGIQDLRQRNRTAILGGQLVDAEIAQLSISPIFRDRLILSLNYILPYPLNNIEVRQRTVLRLTNNTTV